MRKLITYFALVALCLTSAVGSSQTTFTGANSNDWFDPGNWDNGLPIGQTPTIPAGLTVVIPPGQTLIPDTPVDNFGTIEIQVFGVVEMSFTMNNDGLIVNYGILNYSMFSYHSGVGSIINYGTLNTQSTQFVAGGSFENYGTVHNEGAFYNFSVFLNGLNGTFINDLSMFNQNIFYNCLGTYTGNPPTGNPLETVTCPTEEICDGIDNDLDGEFDEGCGCTDAMACNYDPLAVLDDGSCILPGCTDMMACNFNPSAGCPDASCVYAACADVLACNYDPNATCIDITLCTYPGCTDPLACNFDANAGCDSGTCAYDANPCTGQCNNENGQGQDFKHFYQPALWNQSVGTGNGVVTHSTGYLHVRGSNNAPSGDANILTQATILSAMNGSFSFDWEYYTVDGPNYDVAYYYLGTRIDLTNPNGAQYQSGTVYISAGAGDLIGFGVDATDGCCGWGSLLITNFRYTDDICGCYDFNACNFNQYATFDDGSCTYPGCQDEQACNWNPLADCFDNTTCEYPGCTYPQACNYDEFAPCDDGSCEFTTCQGCTYPDATNFDPTKTIDDGSCLFADTSSCEGDYNSDGVISAADLLGFLGVFGTTCAP